MQLRAFTRYNLACQSLALAICVLFFTSIAASAPEAHILRIDPRASVDKGDPVLTTVIEVVQTKRVSDAIAHCAEYKRNAQLSCMAQALEKPQALYTPFPFPAKNAILTASVDGGDFPAKYVSHAEWGVSQQQPNVGTAWLILVDADKRMRSGFDDAKQLAQKIVDTLGPNDIVNVMFFNDRQVVKDSKWLPAAKKAAARSFVDSVGGVYSSQGRNRSLLTIIKTAATDGFKALGNVGEGVAIPLHQAMVVLSSGYGGADAMTSGPGALQLQKYMTEGRFPENNTALPKSPVPVISVYFPHKGLDEFRQNSLEFMQGMANPEIGGFFTVMLPGEGGRSGAIVHALRSRFAKMQIVKWRVSCVATSVTQSFKLVFNNVKPPILGDNTFKDVPVGIDPRKWPLDVNNKYTQDQSRNSPVFPGGKFKVYGNFCWGGDSSRAEVYFIPAGQQLPATVSGADPEKAKNALQQLTAMGMRGKASEATSTFVEFEAPENEKILHGGGSQAVVRFFVLDNKAFRTSGVTANTIVELKGSSRPLPLLWILGGAFGFVLVTLLIVIIVRSGGRNRGGPPPPAPVVAGGGYGAPPAPGGYGAPVPPPQQPPYGAQAPALGGQDFMYGQQPAPGVVAPPAMLPAPPDPYGAGGSASRATLQGSGGVFTIVPGVEMRAGRDGAQCGILLTEPRVSAVHAVLRLDGGQLLVRDESSNNGTLVNGNRLAPGVWSPIPNGSMLCFGPAEFSVRLE